MPDVTINIGGRAFVVACREGEEPFLNAAAALLDKEASALVESGARLTQDRLLLMAGLMLADKTLSTEEELKAMEGRLAQQAAVLDEVQSKPEVVEKLPEGSVDRLEEMAAQAEALADKLAAQA